MQDINMVSTLLLFFLVLPFCVEDSSATPPSLTRIRRYVLPIANSSERDNSKESNYITPISFTETTTDPTDDLNSTTTDSTTATPSTTTTTVPTTLPTTESSTEQTSESTAETPSNETTTDRTDDLNSTTTDSTTATSYTTEPTTTLPTIKLSTESTSVIYKPTAESYSTETTPSNVPAVNSSEINDSEVSNNTTQISHIADAHAENTSPDDSTTTESTLAETTTETSGVTDESTDGTEITTDPTDDLNSTTTDSTTATSSTTTATSSTTTTTEPTTSPTTESSTESTSESSTESTTPSNVSDSGPLTGIIIGIIVAILIVGVGIVLWRAHHSGRLLWPPKNLFSNGLTDPIRPQPVALKKFPAHCSDMLNVPSKLSHEYQLLATLSVDIYATESFVSGQLPDNKCKNRYVNILPYDSTRVKLAPEGDDFYSDYVNASYIKGYTNEIEYIATQGPKEETCRDFWKMVYQEPIKVIIMVTQLEEQGKPKCYKYYPNLRENMELEDIVVRCTTELHFPIYTSRTLILTKGERKRSIIHLHFREWPDFGCPATPDLMLQFCQVMRHNIVLAQPGVTLMHCSAGVGRTGTLIAVDILLQHIKENKKIDIFGTVYKLRKHRMNMVQSEAQYVYIYKCIKEALEDPSYLSSVRRGRGLFFPKESCSSLLNSTDSENSSTTSLEPIYENIECTRLSTVSNKVVQDSVISENECAL